MCFGYIPDTSLKVTRPLSRPNSFKRTESYGLSMASESKKRSPSPFSNVLTNLVKMDLATGSFIVGYFTIM